MILNEKVIDIEKINIDEYYGFIYITHHISKDKLYIGKKVFKRNWKSYLGSGKELKKQIKLCGKGDFKRYIVALTKTEEESEVIEMELIDKYNAVNNERFYNIHVGGSGGYTLAGYTDEEKKAYSENMSKIISEKAKDENYINNVSKGVKEAMKRPDVKQNISKAQLKRFSKQSERDKVSRNSKSMWDNLSVEERARRVNKLVDYAKSDKAREQRSKEWSGENNPKFGTTMSDETKAMLAEARKEKTSKKIVALNRDGEIVLRFNSRREALDFLKLKGHSMLMKSMKQGTLYKGYYWKNDED